MKILNRIPKKGILQVLPESVDDLWHLYNIIYEKDEVYARTTREIKGEEDYVRPKEGKRISVNLGVNVQKVIFDKYLNRLRVHGIVCKSPEKVSIDGSHHTLNLTVNKPVTIKKRRWEKHHLDRLDRSSQKTIDPIVVMSIDDEEYCIAVLRQYGVEPKVEERTRIPGKMEAEKRKKAKQDFFDKASKSLENVWVDVRSPIIIIGPGFLKNEFVKYSNNISPPYLKDIIDVKGVNSGGISGIQEALRSGVLVKTLKHMRIVEETKVMEDILARLGKGRLDVTYGLSEVEKAAMFGAAEKLLIADTLLRDTTDKERLALENLMRNVEEKGGDIMILSAENEAGKKLIALGGIAAFLRFPMDKTSDI